MKILIIYVTTTNDKYSNNIAKFIRDGIFDDDNMTFVIVYNGNNDKKFDIPSYVKVIERSNIGYDFGAWGDVIMNHINYKDYDKFLFLNSSVYGPNIPQYLDNRLWITALTDKLKDDVKLVGCTKNYVPVLHIQSYCWGVDKIFLEYLLKIGYFTQVIENRLDAIFKCEVQNINLLKSIKFKYHVLQSDIGLYGHDDATNYNHLRQLWNNPYGILFIKSAHNSEDHSFKQIIRFDNYIVDHKLYLITLDKRIDESYINKYKDISVIQIEPANIISYIVKNFLEPSLLTIPIHDSNIDIILKKYLFQFKNSRSFPTKKKFIVISNEMQLEKHGIPNIVYNNDMDTFIKDVEYKMCIQYDANYKLKLID